MDKYDAKKLEVSTEWNGKANVCVHCGRVPETFYVATGHDHTDYDIKWCPCRETSQNKDARVVELEAQLATVNDELKLARKGAEFCFKQAKDADANATVQVEARKFFEAQLAERDRSVVKANEQAERFEREWYLRGDELDEAKKLLLLAKDALEKVREVTGSNTFAHNYADEALAAINDSKLIEGHGGQTNG